MNELNEKDLLLIHESLCFVSKNEEKFLEFIKRNDKSITLKKYWEKGKSFNGHELIGYFSEQMR